MELDNETVMHRNIEYEDGVTCVCTVEQNQIDLSNDNNVLESEETRQTYSDNDINKDVLESKITEMRKCEESNAHGKVQKVTVYLAGHESEPITVEVGTEQDIPVISVEDYWKEVKQIHQEIQRESK